uniref:EF-hand domain-containing protein n=1 Tax=Scleropages formosus TaxID=113540 RepID=A0A8C9R9S2_SCLFO
MAATYRLVVSSVSRYSSVVVDHRRQRAVHYCDGPCQLLRQGLDCTIAHHSVCSELTDVCSPLSHEHTLENATFEMARSVHLHNRRFTNGGTDHRHSPPVICGFRRGLPVQAPVNLKNIAGEVINLARGKMKEFSLGYVPLQKRRKVRLDHQGRKSTDVNFLYGRLKRNENNVPFSLLQSSHYVEQQKIAHGPFQKHNIIPLQLNGVAEENLMARLLEWTKVDSGISEKDIRACLNILLKCSSDLKRCTNIITRCIKTKSFGGNDTDHENDPSNAEVLYRTMMSQFCSHLKFSVGFDQELLGDQRCRDVSELENYLHGMQEQSSHHTFIDEQPPRYEDVVCSPPSVKSLPSFFPHAEPHLDDKEIPGSQKSVQDIPTSQVSLPGIRDQQDGSVGIASPQTIPSDNLDIRCSTNFSLPSSKGFCVESLEALYTGGESNVSEVWKKNSGGRVNFGVDSADVGHQVTRNNGNHSVPGSYLANEISENSRNKSAFLAEMEHPHLPSEIHQCTEGVNPDSVPVQRLAENSSSNKDDIERVLMDLERLSQNINEQPQFMNCSQQADCLQCCAFESQNRSGMMSPEGTPAASCKPLGSSQEHLSKPVSDGEVVRNEDESPLLQILENIDFFAQELVESSATTGSKTGTLAHKWSATKLQQDLLASTEGGKNVKVKMMPHKVTERNEPEKEAETLPSPPCSPSAVPPREGNTVVVTPVSASVSCFYLPQGAPVPRSTAVGQVIARIEATFANFKEQRATIHDMGKVSKACGCPLYWKAALFHGAGGETTGFISASSLVDTWNKLSLSCFDESSKFVYLLAKRGAAYLEQEDFTLLLQDIVDSHPGLTFLKDAPEFHSRYITTAIQRIFYTVNRSWTGRITASELRRSNFLQTLSLLEGEDDINQITDYFSYEHFYVIYCKFWELDTDHNLSIDRRDLARYNYHASSERIIERLFSGAVTRGTSAQREGRMSYAEFVWFLISEEDKRSPTSIEYWFRCMDLDGDGVLSMYELEHFYEEQHDRLEAMGFEPLPFHDLLCQMLDLVKPQQPGKITLRDLKRCGMAHVFFDTFFSLEKYLEHEQKDPFAIHKVNRNGQELSDWDRFAAEEYDVLVAEDSESEHPDERPSEGDLECEQLEVALETGKKMEKLVKSELAA